ncbi:MAG: hypothetical protein EOO18_09845, partial [Chryseobacterium sp.]
MKINKLSMVMLLSGTLFFQAADKKEVVAEQNQSEMVAAGFLQQMPANVKDFLAKYYPKATVAKYESKTTLAGKKYEVKLNNGAEIDFDKNGNWEEISDKQGVNPALIPAKIQTYLDQKYKGIKVESIDKD